MTSKVDVGRAGASTSPKLPIIPDGRSLVSPSTHRGNKSPQLGDHMTSWALPIRERLEAAVACNKDVNEEDVMSLKNELVVLIITALQKDNRTSWAMLREGLTMLVPFKELLQDRLEITHYLERVHHHLSVHKERLFDLHIVDTLRKAFPQEMHQIEDLGTVPKKNYCLSVPAMSRSSSGGHKSMHRPVMLLPDGTNPYTLDYPDEKALKPKGLTFADLRASLPDVAMEMATREAIWSACLGTTAQAMNIDLADVIEETSPNSSPVSSRSSQVSMSEVALEDLSHVSEEAGIEQSPPMSGREAVEYFTKCYHTGKVKFMYFNVAKTRSFKPYDLVQVPKNKAGKEHYVFSTFGVLHVYPDQPSDNMTLADWQTEAVLFQAVSHIPFFKHFLIKKMFKRWRAFIHFREYCKIRKQMSGQILQAVPSFGAALLQVSRLCQELLKLDFLPLDTDKCYRLRDFENAVNYMNMQAEKVLERFFRYIRIIIDTTIEESFKKLHHCEEQAKHKTYFSKDSLHAQKMKKNKREQNLLKAREETGQLDSFVKLVDQVVLSHLVQLARKCITSFVYQTMQLRTEASREAFFSAALVFHSQGEIGMSPNKEKFPASLSKSLGKVPDLLVATAVSMETGLLRHHHSSYSQLESDSCVSPEPRTSQALSRLSVSSLRKSHVKVSQQAAVYSSQQTLDCNKSITSHQSSQLPRTPVPPAGDTQNDDELLGSPQLHKYTAPPKEEDSLGQATPDMILSPTKELEVGGQGFIGLNNPLSKGNLEEKLSKDEDYQAALTAQAQLVKEAIDEIDEYCEKNSWLHEIYSFCTRWTDESVTEWKGAAAFTIEQQLNEIRQWTDRVRNSDKTYTTDNSLFLLDCSGIQECLVPRLNAIFKQLCTFIAEEASQLGHKFCEEMKTVMENLKNKQTNMGGFAVYAKNVAKYKKNTPVFQQRVEYIKSLFEVIRMSYRQLTGEEEGLEESVWASWEAFLSHMQDGMEFVNTQTPLITQNLDDTYQMLEEEAYELCETGTTGKFLNPDQKPSEVLAELNKLRERFYEVQTQLHQASKWKEAITGDSYELDFLLPLGKQMDIRHELWKYVDVTTHAIQDWKNTLFRKMSCRKALDKISEWQAAAGQLKPYVPQGDQVLSLWYRSLNDFKQHLPLLHKLSSDAMKPRHWRNIFLGLGEQYDVNHQFTVEELLSYNLAAHSQLILSVHQAAQAEFMIEQNLARIRRLWEDREFKLAKHIPDSVYKDGTRSKPKNPGSAQKTRRMSRYRQDRAGVGSSKGLNVGEDDLYILIEIEELKYLLEDSDVALQAMLGSTQVGDFREESEYWFHSLRELKEIIDLWHTCQIKWLYLLKIFEEPEMFSRMESQGTQFVPVHDKMIDIMAAVVSDPKVMSALSKPRGEKGFRLMQGDRLRDLLISLITKQEEILKDLESLIDRARTQFPRLYFLSNEDVIELLSISRNPQAFQPIVRKCFSGIEGLSFQLPSEVAAKGTSSLDYALNVHHLEVTSIHGALGEVLPLYTQVRASQSATRWLSTLERLMKTTVNTMMEACVQARLEDTSKQPLQILEELSKLEGRTERSMSLQDTLAREIKQSYGQWLLTFPAQCVLVAEAVMWERSVSRALEHQNREELKTQRANLQTRLDQYVSVMKENCLEEGPMSDIRRRLQSLLECLVHQGLHHRDVIDRLLQNENLADSGFDWMRVLKYHMEIRTVLRANANVVDNKPKSAAGPQRPTFDNPQMARSLTMVSTGYQFGRCVLSQLGASYDYTCEYLGPCHRLVCTPLTERAYLTLTNALRTFQCGSLIGPPGVGKTETVKDLAKAIGNHLVTVNSCEELTLPIINQYLTGAICSGCWTLFDDMDHMPQGLLSVFGQQLDYLRNALRVLDSTSGNQYFIRGQPRFDKKMVMKSGEKKIRRNSLTTLHSLPTSESAPMTGFERQTTVPHGFNEEGLTTYFEETWVKERERRHSIEKEIDIKEAEFYKSNKPPPLVYEFVTQHRKPKPNYNALVPQHVDYKPTYIGNVLFNGHLVQANANYGCFMTLNTNNAAASLIPQNIKMVMRQCSLVVPDLPVVMEALLYTSSYAQSKTYAAKLATFFRLVQLQLPRNCHNVSLRTILAVMKVAQTQLRDQLQHQTRTAGKLQKQAPQPKPSVSVMDEEQILIKALNTVFLPTISSPDNLTTFRNLLRDVFPNSARPQSGKPGYSADLIDMVEEQLRHSNLQVKSEIVNKILQMYSALSLGQGVILAGPSGSGKTTCYHTLANTLTALHNRKADDGKDEELTTERSVTALNKQKIKVLQNVETVTTDSTQKWGRTSRITSLLAQTIQTFYDEIEEEDEMLYPQVDVEVLMPNAYTPEELYGYFGEDGLWHGGLLTKLLRNSHSQVESANWFMENVDDKKIKANIDPPQIINKWLVLDGVLNPAWVDGLKSLLVDGKGFSAANKESIKLPDSTSLIFEVTELHHASPSVVSQCGLVWCGNECVSWKSLWETWGQMAKQRWVITAGGWQVLASLSSSLFGQTISFLTAECTPTLVYNTSRLERQADQTNPGIQEVTSFLRLMSAMLDKYFRREDYEKAVNDELQTKMKELQEEIPVPPRTPRTPRTPKSRQSLRSRMSTLSRVEDHYPNYMTILRNMFAFAYIWGFGGHLHDSCMEKFDKFAQESLCRAAQPILLPEGLSVYDVYVEPRGGNLLRWSDRTLEKPRNVTSHYTVVPEVDRYNYMTELLASIHQPVLITGNPGVGKTCLLEYLVQTKNPFTKVNISPGQRASRVQKTMTSHILDTKVKGSGLPGSHNTGRVKGHILFCLEDLHTAASDGRGSQPVLEFVRQILCEKSVFHSQRHVPISMSEVNFIATATTPGMPGSGHGHVSHAVSSRLSRLFTVLTFFQASEQVLHSIYGKAVLSWLEEFPTYSVEHHAEFTRALVQGAIDVYKQVCEHLRPTPSNAHYLFSLHNLAHVFEGILLMSPRSRSRAKLNGSRKDTAKFSGTGSLTGRSSTSLSNYAGTAPMMRSIVRLWCHECTRVFGDRIIGNEDKLWFDGLLSEVAFQQFCTSQGDHMSTIMEDALSHRGATPTDNDVFEKPEGTLQCDDQSSKELSAEEFSKNQTIADHQHKDDSSKSDPQASPSSHSKLTGQVVTDVDIEAARHSEIPPTAQPAETPYTTEAETTTTVSHQAPEHGMPEEEDTSDDEDSTTSEDSTESDSTLLSTDAESRLAQPQNLKAKTTSRETSSRNKPASSLSRQSTDVSEGQSRSGSRVSNRGTPILKRSTSKGNKRGVTFRAGLISDREMHQYSGPLLSMDQIKESHEHLSDIVFSKYILSTYADTMGVQVDKGYSECSDEQLAEALRVCLAQYNHSTGQQIDLVFFREAAHHIARISRVLATPAGHAMLLSLTMSTGRATLVRLAAHFSNCKLFEPKPGSSPSESQGVVHDHMKRCSRAAAFQGKQVVLLLHQDLGIEALQDACALLKEGQCPGLYSFLEMQNIATQMTPGQVKTTRVDKIDMAFTKYLNRVKQNLHLVVLVNYNTTDGRGSLQSCLARVPALLSHCCSIDVYHPWTHQAFVAVAEAWLVQPSPKMQDPWSETNKAEQVSLVATAMAYIHNSSQTSLTRLYSRQATQLRIFSPLTFKEFVHLFFVIAAYITRNEKAKMKKYDAGLAKIKEASGTISGYRREVSELVPHHQEALQIVKDHVEAVEVQRQDYIQALDQCKEAEERIEGIISPLERLREDAQQEFAKVNPKYLAAVEVLYALKPHDVEEIRSYRAPPQVVITVTSAICLLYKENQDWDTAKSLMSRENFFKDLQFYDKDNISDSVYEVLGNFIKEADLPMEKVRCVSCAAEALWGWVQAIHTYANVCRCIKPKLRELKEAEEELCKAQALLGSQRVEANRVKSALESRIQSHKEAVREAKAIEKKIQGIERNISKASNLMDNMSMQHSLWRSELRLARGKLKTTVADALLTAACISYHGPLDSTARSELLTDWLNHCEAGSFDPSMNLGQQEHVMSLSAKLESLMRPAASMTESVHSLQHVENSHLEVDPLKAEDGASIGDQERISSAQSIHQHPTYQLDPAPYSVNTLGGTQHLLPGNQLPVPTGADTESVAASTVSTRNLLAVRENFSLTDVLSSFEELSEWKQQNLPTDNYSVDNVLMVRVASHNQVHCWPLLVDPDDRAEMWVRALQQSRHIIREEDISTNIEGLQSVPVSRGTVASMLTDCMVGEESADQVETNSSEIPSHPSPNTTNDNQNCTVVDQVDEKVTITADEFIDRPNDNMWITAADDRDFEKKVVNAIVHGVTVLVTHLERCPQNVHLHSLLLRRISINQEGHRVIQLHNTEVPCHSDFHLYFSISVPLFFKGGGVFTVPLHRTNVISMCPSEENLHDSLLSQIMRIERPEFEGQKRSIEADLIHTQHELNREQEVVMQKTLELSDPLLDDKDMLEVLKTCQKNVERLRMIQEETHYLEGHLEEKRQPYVSVAIHGARLHQLVQQVALLNPMYHVSLKTFLKLFADNARRRHRGKGAQGDLKARAKELMDSATSCLYQYVSLMTFEQHTILFAVLIALEHLHTSQHISQLELDMFVDGIDTSQISDNLVPDNKPQWMTNKMWVDCCGLETALPAFHGLRESVIDYSKDWQEYLKCDVELLSPLPGTQLDDLSIFHKCLLWRVLAPHRMSEICQALVLYEIGGTIQDTGGYNVHEVYELSDKATPVIILLPADHLNTDNSSKSIKGSCCASPSQDILQFAKDRGMEGKVQVLACGIRTQMCEIQHALEDCMTAGYWLVVQNAHLAQPWTSEILSILKIVVQSKSTFSSQDPNTSEGKLSTSSTSSMDSIVTGSVKSCGGEQNGVHDNFRLWVTTRTDSGQMIPGSLILHGVKMACELTLNFKNTLYQTYTTVSKHFNRRDQTTKVIKKMYGRLNFWLPLALLHSVLLHRSNYGRSAFVSSLSWSQADLAAMLDLFRLVLLTCQSHHGAAGICGQVYSGHCVEKEDYKVVEALTSDLLLCPKQLSKALVEESSLGMLSLLKRLMPSATEMFDQRLDTLISVTATTLGLPESAQTELTQTRSKNLVEDLVAVCGSPELITRPLDVSYNRAQDILEDILSTLQDLPDIPQTKPDGFYPMEQFYHSEVQINKQLLEVIKSDVSFLLGVARGEVTASPQSESLLMDISQQKIPSTWLVQSFPMHASVTSWVAHFKSRLTLLTNYVNDTGEEPMTFDLASFHRPDRFMQAVLQTFIRKEFRDLQKCALSVQVLNSDLTPKKPANPGVYLTNLWLHNATWDYNQSALVAESKDTVNSMQKMPILWLKPISQASKSPGQINTSMYECPVYMSMSFDNQCDKNMLIAFELASSQPTNLMTERRVCISCSNLPAEKACC